MRRPTEMPLTNWSPRTTSTCSKGFLQRSAFSAGQSLLTAPPSRLPCNGGSIMIPLAARFRFLALLVSLMLSFVGAGLARGDIIVQYTFPIATADPDEREGLGFEATTLADDAIATGISLSP